VSDGWRKIAAVLEIAPFRVEHLDAAAPLLAARHRNDRVRMPDLPARFEAHGASVHTWRRDSDELDRRES
jgi:hypothetical protein